MENSGAADIHAKPTTRVRDGDEVGADVQVVSDDDQSKSEAVARIDHQLARILRLVARSE